MRVKGDTPPGVNSNEEGNSSKILPCQSILIVDDDDMSYHLINESLKKVNIITYRANNGLEALEMIKTQRTISLVLMDINMPVMNGLDATRHIKKIRPKTPVIMQSSYAQNTEIKNSFKAGCDDYITKPIDFTILLSKISSYCSF